MATGRFIHRDSATSADLEDLPATGRLLFLQMIVWADNAGVIRHHPSFFKHTLLHRLKVGPKKIQTYLDHLQERSCISLVTLQGVKCWKITNFAEFQRLKRREGKRTHTQGKSKQVDAQEAAREGPPCVCDSLAPQEGALSEREAVLERLRTTWGYPQVGEAEALVEAHAGRLTAAALDAWDALFASPPEALRGRATNLRGYLRQLMRSFATPEAAGFKPEPDAEAFSSAWGSTVSDLRALDGFVIVDRDGREWKPSSSGIDGPRGFKPYGQGYAVEELREVLLSAERRPIEGTPLPEDLREGLELMRRRMAARKAATGGAQP